MRLPARAVGSDAVGELDVDLLAPDLARTVVPRRLRREQLGRDAEQDAVVGGRFLADAADVDRLEACAVRVNGLEQDQVASHPWRAG